MNLSQSLAQIQPVTFKDLKRIRVDQIVSNKLNPRDQIARKEVEDLKKSIQAVGGILVPLVVYERGDGKYVLLDGERRWRAAKELKLEEVPANILANPVNDFENLRTMFNIHLQRKDWSTAARAVALGRMMKMSDTLAMSPQQIKEILPGMTRTKFEEAKLLLRCPRDLIDRCLAGELNEYYLILIARGLDACFKAYPDLTSEYTWEDSVRNFVKKVDDGWVRNVISSRTLAIIASKCIDLRADSLFKKTFRKLNDVPSFTFEEAEVSVDAELGYRVEETFTKQCRDFLTTLKRYYKSHKKDVSAQTRDLLLSISSAIQRAR